MDQTKLVKGEVIDKTLLNSLKSKHVMGRNLDLPITIQNFKLFCIHDFVTPLLLLPTLNCLNSELMISRQNITSCLL